VPVKGKKLEHGFKGTDVNRLFERFVDESFYPLARKRTLSWYPPVDIEETEEHILLRVELPAVDPERIDLSVTGEVVRIHGNKEQDKTGPHRTYHVMERTFGPFRREIPLPVGIETDSVEASYRQGVLCVRLRKLTRSQRRTIPVSGG